MTEQGLLGAQRVTECNSPVPSDLLLVIIDLSKTHIKHIGSEKLLG